jgi:hypothetical protein
MKNVKIEEKSVESFTITLDMLKRWSSECGSKEIIQKAAQNKKGNMRSDMGDGKKNLTLTRFKFLKKSLSLTLSFPLPTSLPFFGAYIWWIANGW